MLASNDENVLLPLNEPTYGTKRKSQIQTYLEQNRGEGVQHMALLTDDIFHAVRRMREMGSFGGFEFMPQPSAGYYVELPSRLGDALSKEQYSQVQELGLLGRCMSAWLSLSPCLAHTRVCAHKLRFTR